MSMDESNYSKKIYVIKETQPAIQTWIYEVEAFSEEEAIEAISNGDVEPLDYQIQESVFDDYELDVIKVKWANS